MNAFAIRRRQRGFTLIEAVITVALLVILLGIAAPSMRTFTYAQRVKTGSFDLYSSLMYARSEAIKRRADVTVTPVANNWNNGWEVKVGADVLRSQEALKGINITLAPAAVTYRLDGRVTNAAEAVLALEATSDADSAGRRCITVDTTGLPRARKLSGSAACS